MEEIWKPVGIKNYQVSNLGRVIGQDGIRILKPAKNHHGYLYVLICNNGVDKHRFIHHLVMEAFIGVRENGLVCDHINRIRDDNRLENLRYLTPMENSMNACNYDTSVLEHGKERYKIKNKLNYWNNREARLEYAAKRYSLKTEQRVK